ncbi:acyl-CoA thioesterase [Paeniglutamicibacter terrestris]|uniref:Acyl-CoA thioesterase n=1 Tax=Paeniglutamicibacter terrestris TaxID=2723403 RepID=A0ABX1G1Q5_9MICC|nr:hotdog domain-containing protein [Paeniglutamicibacter terrestris]ASN37676.1 acyl-CoA thioesterase [Arthrobacter sp. 7749]NKG20158.1 acyl-CoA thioesterase [Paeniglutamicibacter terrestris]
MNDVITLRFLAAPTDVSEDGVTVQAGRVLEWIDKAGYACAVGYSGGYCVTAYVGNVHFTRPIENGDLIEVTARIVHTGRSSMQVVVTVDAADVRERVFRPAMDCILVFVAMDENRRAKTVQQWVPLDAEGAQLAQGAADRVAVRAEIRDAMRAQEYTDAGTAPREKFRFLASPSDVNWGGNAHGGIVMRWIDEVARACAMGWSGKDAVAVYSGGIHFMNPIHIGDIVELEARLIHTGPHSMHIAVHVRARDPRETQWRDTTQCMTIFVTRDESGRASEVRQLVPVNEEDKRLDAHAVDLICRRAELAPLGFVTARVY